MNIKNSKIVELKQFIEDTLMDRNYSFEDTPNGFDVKFGGRNQYYRIYEREKPTVSTVWSVSEINDANSLETWSIDEIEDLKL